MLSTLLLLVVVEVEEMIHYQDVHPAVEVLVVTELEVHLYHQVLIQSLLVPVEVVEMVVLLLLVVMEVLQYFQL
jgi:hypothetical protein